MLKVFYPSILCLDDGTLYRGWSFFRNCISCGEIVFNTGMTGYQEIITDPSYFGQILVFTYPELGNTGLNVEDSESSLIHTKGIVAKNISISDSNWRSTISLKNYIEKKKIPHIFGIDTRSLTRYIRLKGVMSAYIANKYVDPSSLFCSNIDFKLNSNLVQQVTKRKGYYCNVISGNLFVNNSYLNHQLNNIKKMHLHVVLIDFGVKSNILYRLLSYGCSVYVLPATVTYDLILKYKPDGVLLSNGPGDPSVLINSMHTIKKLVKFSDIPIFGICMGHQLLNLSNGLSTFKLKFGHRGLNHPSGLGQHSEITSQNHGFAVNLKNKPNYVYNKEFKVTHFNLNDSTLGGVAYNFKPVFSVQHHPEASPGPHDADYLFQSFIDLMYRFKISVNL